MGVNIVNKYMINDKIQYLYTRKPLVKSINKPTLNCTYVQDSKQYSAKILWQYILQCMEYFTNIYMSTTSTQNSSNIIMMKNIQ